VVQGFLNLDIVTPSLSLAIGLLQSRDTAHLVPALILPLFVMGSVAGETDKRVFRDVFSSPPVLDPLFGHRGKILPLLEEIWKGRQLSPTFAWKDCLEIIGGMLLI